MQWPLGVRQSGRAALAEPHYASAGTKPVDARGAVSGVDYGLRPERRVVPYGA